MANEDIEKERHKERHLVERQRGRIDLRKYCVQLQRRCPLGTLFSRSCEVDDDDKEMHYMPRYLLTHAYAHQPLGQTACNQGR